MTTDPKDAEIARLRMALADTEALEMQHGAVIERLTAERDAALAQVAGAFEAAAEFADEWDTIEQLLPFMDDKSNACAHTGQHEARERIANGIRTLPPADALAALSRRDAQMRAEGRKEGLRAAAGIAYNAGDPNLVGRAATTTACRDAILAAVETIGRKGRPLR